MSSGVSLTERQAEAVRLTWHGLTNRAIARQLGVKAATANNILWQAHRALGVATGRNSRVAAAVKLFLAEYPNYGGRDGDQSRGTQD